MTLGIFGLGPQSTSLTFHSFHMQLNLLFIHVSNSENENTHTLWCNTNSSNVSVISLIYNGCTFSLEVVNMVIFEPMMSSSPFSILMDNINSIPIFQFSAPTETSLVPWESSQPIQTPNYKLSPRLITMVQSLSFLGGVDENPYLHIRDFEQTCDCLRIECMSDQTLRWKLFPFSLREKLDNGMIKP
jgi:hypothetical protein